MQKTENRSINRRDFFSLAGWVSLLTVMGGWLVAGLRYLFPNVLYEPQTTFRIGMPEDYQVSLVTFLKEQRVFILREPEGFHAFSAVCTHLGCTVVWQEAHSDFECPCHGSKFNRDGEVIKSPAPKPLARLHLSLAEDGQLVVDTQRTVERDFMLRVT